MATTFRAGQTCRIMRVPGYHSFTVNIRTLDFITVEGAINGEFQVLTDDQGYEYIKAEYNGETMDLYACAPCDMSKAGECAAHTTKLLGWSMEQITAAKCSLSRLDNPQVYPLPEEIKAQVAALETELAQMADRLFDLRTKASCLERTMLFNTEHP